MTTITTPSKGLHFLIAGYVLCILLANLMLDQFIPLPAFGLLSIGTIFFAAIFTLRDRIHAAGGLRPVYVAIALAIVVNAVAAYALGTELRFIAASFLSILVSELVDTAIFQKLLHRSWAVKVLSSNAVSVPLDTVLFTLLAFYGIMSTSEIVQIIYADIVVKYGISMLLIVRWHLVGRERQERLA
ncbi:MAG: hypothetical protein CR974_04410 [Gammaproteobacteria bacterium]|nr:MAG: hypothetical protein CR974_04410 [Gammaproteobacteria bacterium]